jgi:transcriptional regulator with XRE-family HTH domain
VNIGERIGRWRESRGLSQAGLAAKLGLSRNAIWKWEAGKAAPSSDKLDGIARACGVSLSRFWAKAPARKRRAA